jgi:HlyD family secretion protein
MNKINSSLKKIFINKWLVWSVLVLIIGVSGFLFFKGNGAIETIIVTKSDFINEVSVVGTVIPAQETNMAFEMSGRVVAIYKKVGDPVKSGEQILALESGDIRSDLLKAQADYQGEIAKLNKLKNNNSTTDLISLKNEIRNAYTVADDAIRSKTDQIFEDPNSRFPNLKIFVSKSDTEKDIENQRYQIRLLFTLWSEKMSQINSAQNVTELTEQINYSKQNLNKTLDYLNDVSYAISISEVNSAITQSDLDKYSSDVSSARTNVNNALSDLNTAFEKVSTNSLDIPYQESQVQSALANVQKVQSQLYKNSINSPFEGTITKIDTEIGEIVGTTDSVISIISNNAFQIETFVPEVNIKELKINDVAKIRLDAFGKDEYFDAKVISIEPAQTVRDGVATYKTKFEFNQKDERIRSGMTANVVITTEKRNDAILISPTVIYKKDGFDYVKVLVGKNIVEKQITVGNFDSIGHREIISGLSVGEKVLKNPNN